MVKYLKSISTLFLNRCQKATIENSPTKSSAQQSRPFLWLTPVPSKWFAKAATFVFQTLIGVYQAIGSLWLGGSCRFEPSCSAYAQEAFSKHPFYRAAYLSVHRLMKCRPGGGMGYDPVPEPERICHIHQRGHHGSAR
ncbi:MAG: membrane protein insertion efficiency factor YidD [Bdellovibrio sp. CG10_big_fil_rev_8_21_14_0_10_47_8]|nr:MAG: membrane protein insertion efficiency factor YidD [Bdellovibrio sp. CG10_big_fil_rev_8_21_14_0_10_47_8]